MVQKQKYIKSKQFTTSDYNKFTNNILDTKQHHKSCHKSGWNGNIKALTTEEEIKKATNTELKAEQGNIEKVKTYDLSIFIGET